MSKDRPLCVTCAKFRECWGGNNPHLDGMTPEARTVAMEGYAKVTAAPAWYKEKA